LPLGHRAEWQANNHGRRRSRRRHVRESNSILVLEEHGVPIDQGIFFASGLIAAAVLILGLSAVSSLHSVGIIRFCFLLFGFFGLLLVSVSIRHGDISRLIDLNLNRSTSRARPGKHLVLFCSKSGRGS